MIDYTAIYNKMKPDVWYKASDLGAAAASMTAMAKRGLVEKKLTKPLTYRKLEAGKAIKILEYAKKEGREYFTLFNKDTKLGMLCSIKNNTVIDCWGKIYDASNVDRMCVYDKGSKAEYFL